MAASDGNSSGAARMPHLKNYVFGPKLGSGTYATVYKAFYRADPHHRQVVAVKCLLRQSLSKSSSENLLKEIGILKSIRHEFIVELKDFQWDQHYIYMIMEYCSGGDLSQFIRQRRTGMHAVPEAVVRSFFQQIAAAFQYLHQRNISHMDLKPQNILLSSRDRPTLKLADFGFSQFIADDEYYESFRGSPLYMAPEIFTRRRYNASCDLWSLGVILYECIYGRAPFSSHSFEDLRGKILDTSPVELPRGAAGISDSCHDLLGRLLQRDPEQRIGFDEFFWHPFVDLEHAPSAGSLDKARRLVTAAVEKDGAGQWADALKLYSQSLEHFVPAVQYEKSPAKKGVLRAKVKEYMDRAEELKVVLKPKKQVKPSAVVDGKVGQTGLRQKEGLQLLLEMSEGDQPLWTALKKAEIAEITEESELYEDALKEYEESLQELLRCLNAEAPGVRKDLLNSEIRRFMGRAEDIKGYIAAQKMHIKEIQNSIAYNKDSGDKCAIQ